MYAFKPQKNSFHFVLGACGALGCALCYLVGFIMIFWIEPGVQLHAEKKLNYVLQNGLVFQTWYFFVFLGFSLFFLLLLRAIKQWIGPDESLGYYLTNMFGFIWSSYIFVCGLISILTIQYVLSLSPDQQRGVWMVIFLMQSGLGDGAEWVGGIWLTTSSWHLLSIGKGPKIISILGLISGFSGCFTLIPGFAFAGVIFGLSQLVWFILIAKHLLLLSSLHDRSFGLTVTR